MTDGTFTDGDVVDGHLTDEELSSHLDGASDTDRDVSAGRSAGQHLATCAQCRDRLATLEAVREVLSRPLPPLAPEVRAESIASVLRAAEDAQVDAGADADADARAHFDPRTRVQVAKPPTPIRTRPRPGVLVGSAAAVLVLAVAVGIPLALSKGTSSTSSSAGREVLGKQHRQQASGANRLAANANAGAADLGALDSVAALRSRVTALLAADKAAASPNPVPAPASAFTTTTGGAPTSVPATTVTTVAQAAAATTPTSGSSRAGPGTSGQGEFNVEANAATTRQFELCLSSAMHAVGPKRSLQLLATAELKGKQTLVYVFLPATSGSAKGNSARSLAVATARDGCRVLGTTTL